MGAGVEGLVCRQVEPDEGGSELELRDYLRVLRRRAWVVVLAVLIAVGSSVALSLAQTPQYAATAQVELQAQRVEDFIDPGGAQRADPARRLQTQLQVIESRRVRDRVLAEIADAPPVKASPVGQTDIVSLRVESPDPVVAQRAADAYAEAYIQHRLDEDQAELARAIEGLQRRVVDVDAQIAAGPAADRTVLERTRNSLIESQQNLESALGLKTGGARVLEFATLPTEPFSPKTVRNALLALVLGAMLGVGLAFLLEYLDDTIKTKEDLERATGLPVIGLIPVMAGAKRDEPAVGSLDDPSSSAAEAYRTLRTSIQFMSFDKPVQVVQVTSASASEGKTTTIANLGVALARAGRQVTVMCCDLRRPRLHKFFGLENDVGFTSVLLRETKLASALQTVDEVPRLTVLASGPVPPNPSELLASKAATEMIAPLTKEERVVLVDSPPVLPVTDAMVISRWADVTLLVCSAGHTRRGEVQRAVELLQRVGAPIVGTVLNGVKNKAGYGYDYRYQYQHYQLSPNGNGPGPNGEHQRSRRKRLREIREG
jgi:polysaccharide biosynthesis transport protein